MSKFIVNTNFNDESLSTDELFTKFEKKMYSTNSADRIKKELAEKMFLTSFIENRQLNSALKEKKKKAPSFYMKERLYSFVGLSIVMLIGIGLLFFSLYLWFYLSNESDKNVIYLIIPAWVFFTAIFYTYLNRFLKINSEIKSYDFMDDQREPSINILKIYKRCKLSYLNLNYLGASVYLTCSIAIVTILTYVWANNLIASAGKVNNYGAITFFEFPEVKWPLYVVVVFGLVLVGYLIFHIIMLLINNKRANSIEAYYRKPLLSETDMVSISKKRNKRNLILFLSYIASLFLIIFFFYKFIRKMLWCKKR